MEIKEMRVGNYYHWSAEGKDYLLQVDRKDFKDDNHLNFESIPLTEEWLLKFGAERFGNGDLNIKGHLISWMDCRKIFVHRATSVELKYIHIWQNLYFALTGQELILNEQI